MKELLLNLLLLSFISSYAQVSFTKVPKRFALFPRNDKDSASVPFEGVVSNNVYDSIIIESKKDNNFYLRKSYKLNYVASKAKFNGSIDIKAELKNYHFTVYGSKNNIRTLVLEADSIVAGDVFVITGQSNAAAYTGNRNANQLKNAFVRSFGNAIYDKPDLVTKDTIWGWANASDPKTEWTPGLFTIGDWGLKLGKSLVESTKIPVCFINGAVGGTGIGGHQQGYSIGSIYGRIFYRLKKAGLLNSVKAFFWHQGESDTNSGGTAEYRDNFSKMIASWQSDYKGISKIYYFQIRATTYCEGGSGDDLREVQRSLVTLSPTLLQPMSTFWNDFLADDCHYTTEGYWKMGESLYPMVVRDFYANINSLSADAMASAGAPDVSKAYYTTSNQIVVELTQDVTWPADKGNNKMIDYFYFDNNTKITQASVQGNKLILQVSGSAKAEELSYLNRYYNNTTNLYKGPYITNKNGIGLFAFKKFSVKSTEPTSADGQMDIEATVNIFPNPAQHQVTLTNTPLGTDIKLLDLQGKELISKKTTTETTELNIQALPQGLYIVKVGNSVQKLTIE